jgi:hypothetical protein
MLVFSFIIYALASYGIAFIMTSLDGPGNVFLKLRNKYPNSALKCLICTLTWVTLLLLPLLLLGLWYVFIPFAAVGAAIIIEDITR